MVWADIDGDKDQDIVIVGDWMPVKVFINNNNAFTDESEKYKLVDTEGWWHTITAKDLNGDGKTDFILGNNGLNSRFKASPAEPVTMYVNDFDLNGSVEQIICSYNGNKSYPLIMMDDLLKQIPSLETKYKKNDDYKEQTMEDIFSPDVLNRSLKLKANYLESCILMNKGDEGFKIYPLPSEAQFAPVYAISAEDFDKDGICDILLGGNQFRAKPETGIYAASYGLLLKGNSDGMWEPVSPLVSGIYIKGEIRDFKSLVINGHKLLTVAKNNNKLQFYKY